MIGALIGDIVGSVYEFNNIKTKEFPLLGTNSHFTDDSVMTLAVAEIMQKGYMTDSGKITATFRKWGKNFINAGYGGTLYPLVAVGKSTAIRQLWKWRRHAGITGSMVWPIRPEK